MAYEKQTWNTTSYVNPTRMNHIEDGIDKAGTARVIGSITAQSGETLSDFVDRLRDNYFADDISMSHALLQFEMDGTTNLIFNCVRWTGRNVSIWCNVRPTSDSSLTILLIAMSSSAVNVRKYVTSSSGVTGTNISSNSATGTASVIATG